MKLATSFTTSLLSVSIVTVKGKPLPNQFAGQALWRTSSPRSAAVSAGLGIRNSSLPAFSYNCGRFGRQFSLLSTHGPSMAARHLPLRTPRGGALQFSKNTMPPVIFDNGPFFQSQKIFLISNVIGYLITLVASKHYHVDLLGTGAFASAALPHLLMNLPTATGAASAQRIRWSASAVIAWSSKLALFLLCRVVATGGHDNRLTEILENPVWSAGFWGYSLFWGMLCSLPHTLGATSSSPGNPIALRIGGFVFGLGWIFETLADYQKWNFKKGNPGQFCDAGLWSISQHPNWFGNLLVWTGIFIMNVPALVEPVVPNASILKKLWGFKRVGLALLSPMFMWYLFSSQATGAMLAESFEAHRLRYGYGENEAFTKYIDDTPLIVPNPLKWFSSKP